MRPSIDAVIFDMDGVLINSEPLWRRAMITVFSRYGMLLTEDECRQTMGMRFVEVIALWLHHHKKSKELLPAIDAETLDELIRLINHEGQILPGVQECLDLCKCFELKTGLATSSSVRLMTAIVDHLQLRHYFQSMVSAENLPYGKPHPEVFLKCAGQLGVNPRHCLVIEDSLNGVVAGKAASMQVIAVPDDENLYNDKRREQQFMLADYRANNMQEVAELIKEILHGSTGSHTQIRQ